MSTKWATSATAPMPPTSCSTSSTPAASSAAAWVFTTNKPLEDWGAALHDYDLAEAVIDRVLERGRIVALEGPSMRTRHLQGIDYER